ncbi:hypothetical protein HK102_010812, partial [Quaeritorhiza haematococci]
MEVPRLSPKSGIAVYADKGTDHDLAVYLRCLDPEYPIVIANTNIKRRLFSICASDLNGGGLDAKAVERVAEKVSVDITDSSASPTSSPEWSSQESTDGVDASTKMLGGEAGPGVSGGKFHLMKAEDYATSHPSHF